MSKVKCPSCGTLLDLKQQPPGQQFTCPSCSRKFALKKRAEAPPAHSSAPAASHAGSAPKGTDPSRVTPHAKTMPEAGGSILSSVDAALSDTELLEGPRALLLLRICQYAQVVRPDILRNYWPKLLTLRKKLPANQQEAFEALRTAVDPPRPQELGGFAGEVIAQVNEGVRQAASDRDAACKVFLECEQRLRKRWWWPFGKGPAWTALVQAWAETDRASGLRRINKLTRAAQQNLLGRLNDRTPLTPAEWDLAHESTGVFGSIIPVVKDLLDKGQPVLRLSGKMVKGVGQELRREITSSVSGSGQQLKDQHEKSYHRYLRLVACVLEKESANAGKLLEELFLATASSTQFLDQWPNRFTTLRRLITDWLGIPQLRKQALAFLADKPTDDLRDFCLAHMYGLVPDTQDDAAKAYRAVANKSREKAACEAWFLVTLVRRGLGPVAMDLARSSPRAKQLIPRLRRAWVCEHPDTAMRVFSPADFEGDIIGQFLLMPSARERAAFLRKHTRNGSRPLPGEMWSKPELEGLLNRSPGQERRNVEGLYLRNVPLKEQFGEYLELFGYGYYSHEDIDPHLLAALTAWDEEHPQEVDGLLRSMWQMMALEETVITEGNLNVSDMDRQIRMIRSGETLRSSVFERCQAVFPAHPGAVVEVFAAWVKANLVGKQVYVAVNNQLGHITTKETAPFIHCLIAAQNAARISPKRRDEILTRAVAAYTADVDVLTGAGQLYAADKGFRALRPPAKLENSSLLEAWQVGVVQVALPALRQSLTTPTGQ